MTDEEYIEALTGNIPIFALSALTTNKEPTKSSQLKYAYFVLNIFSSLAEKLSRALNAKITYKLVEFKINGTEQRGKIKLTNDANYKEIFISYDWYLACVLGLKDGTDESDITGMVTTGVYDLLDKKDASTPMWSAPLKYIYTRILADQLL